MAHKNTYLYVAWTRPYSTWTRSMYFRTLAAAYAWFRSAIFSGVYDVDCIRIYQHRFDEYDSIKAFGVSKDLTDIFIEALTHEVQLRNCKKDSHGN